MSISEKMQRAIDTIKQHDGILIRWSSNCWTFKEAITLFEANITEYPDFYKNAEAHPFSVSYNNMLFHKLLPEWWCFTNTLKSLKNRSIVNLDETNGVCILIQVE